MRKILKSKKGVTILEGLIALSLLALVATGTFAVLLSSSRKSSGPDIREEMALAVERASQLLQGYVVPVNASGNTQQAADLISDSSFKNEYKGLCGGDSSPLSTGTHYINCMLPPICDASQSSFFYKISNVTEAQPITKVRQSDQAVTTNADGTTTSTRDISGEVLRKVHFEIKCNGFTL